MTKKILGNILFLMTLISPNISLFLASIIGEANIFGVAGIIRYSWVMLLFIPIGILSILVGLKLKNSKQKYKKNLIIAFICLPLLIIFGSYRFIFILNGNVSYDTEKISIIEEKIKFKFPNEIKIATNKLDLCNLSYVKINDESKDLFEQEIMNSQLWHNSLDIKIRSLLPLDIQYQSKTFEYFLFYNITNDEYNIFPTSKEFEAIFIAYDCDLQRIMILDDYTVNIN